VVGGGAKPNPVPRTPGDHRWVGEGPLIYFPGKKKGETERQPGKGGAKGGANNPKPGIETKKESVLHRQLPLEKKEKKKKEQQPKAHRIRSDNSRNEETPGPHCNGEGDEVRGNHWRVGNWNRKKSNRPTTLRIPRQRAC